MGSPATTVDDLPILFEDDHVVVTVKPSGLATANAPRGTDSVFTILKRRAPGAFLGVVSRLDAPVSGLVVLAKTSPAAASLAGQFRERTVEKSYAAIVTGRFPAPLGEWVDWHDAISRPAGDAVSRIHRNPDAVRGTSGADDKALTAHARCRVVCRAGEVSLVELEPSTGRRHQLRAQLASRGCPIVGDRRYGSRLPCRSGGIALHAERLGFTHPASGDVLGFHAPCRDRWGIDFPSLFATSGPSGRGW